MTTAPPEGTPETAPADAEQPAAETRDLHLAFGSGPHGVEVVRGVSLRLQRGRVLALVGESGSGKSLTALALLGLLPTGARVAGGSVLLDGVDTARFSPAEWRGVRGSRIAMVFQDPAAALNPSFTVGWQIAEPFRRRLGDSRRRARAKAVALMTTVGIPEPERRYHAYPHEFSGGMRQRAVVAMALALEPAVLLADEPTTALDVTVQAQILRLLAERQRAAGLAMLLVSHDLGVVAKLAQEVAVVYAGRVVEHGALETVYAGPAHPYTRGLMDAVPEVAAGEGRLRAIPGQPPDPGRLPDGCAFHPRCAFATARCTTQLPALRALADGRRVACHHAERVLAGEPAEEDGVPGTAPDGGSAS